MNPLIDGFNRIESSEKDKFQNQMEQMHSVMQRTSITNNPVHTKLDDKRKVDVLIDGLIYTLVSEDDETYMQKVAFYINQKIADVKKMESARNLDLRELALLASINIADEYLKSLTESKEDEISLQNAKAEIDIYKNEYKKINDENEKLKAEIEKLKLENMRLGNRNY